MIGNIWNGINYAEKNVALDAYFSQKLNDITLAQSTSLGDETITLESGHNVVVGDWIELYDGLHFMQIEVEGVDGDEITLNIPVDNTYTPETTVAKRVNVEMNIDGSTEEQTFCFGMYGNATAQFVALSGIMTHSSKWNDGRFGGLDPLNKGIFIGSERQTTSTLRKTTHLWSGLKTNGDIRIRASSFAYSERAPGDGYSTIFRVDFLDQNVSNIILRGVKGICDDRIFLKIRDDLTGLTSFRMLATGNIFLR